MNIPSTLRVGDTTSWRDEPMLIDGVRVESSTYVLTHILAGPILPITLTATADGAGWKTQLTVAQADALVAGEFSWQAVLTATDQRITVGSGQITVLPNLASAAMGFNGKTLAEKALADAEAALANYRANGGKIKSYTIGMRAMTFADSGQILQEINYWKNRVSHEKAQQRIKNGLGNPRNLQVRFK